MAFENSQAFNFESKKMVNTEQFESVCRFIVPSEKPINKIVSVHAIPKIVSNEKVGDSVLFSGSTSYQVVYLTENDKLTSVSFSQDWQESISLVGQGEYFLNINVQENTVSDHSQIEIVLSTLLNVELFMVMSDLVKSVENLTEDYVTSEKVYSYNKVVNTIHEHFTEVSEQELSQKVEEVLFSNTKLNITNVSAGIDSVTVEGEATINSCLFIDNKVTTVKKVIDFKQEVASLSVVPDNLVDLNAFVTNCKVTASVSDIDEKTNLIYTLEIGVDAVIYELNSINIIEDAFSVKKKTNLSSECLLKTTYHGQNIINFSLDSSFEADRNLEEVLFLTSVNASVTDIKTLEEETTVSGVIELNLACKDENGEIVTVKGFVPFFNQVNEVLETSKIISNVNLESFKLRDKREIEMTLNVNLIIKNYMDEYVTAVSSIEETEERVGSNEAINVYVVNENEKLFDVAKNLCVKPEDIINQNDIQESEITEGTRLVVYTPLDINF